MQHDETAIKKSDSVTHPMKAEIKITRKERYFIYLIFVGMNFLINMDHGIIPAATIQMKSKNDINVNDSQLGILGTLVYLGNLIGSIITMIIIRRYHRKLLLIIYLILNGVAMLTFTFTSNIGFLYFNRCITGVFQSFVTIYCPVWVDQFGTRTKKTIMMAVLQAASPIGVVFGYGLTALIQSSINWNWAFRILSFISFILAGSLIFVQPRFFAPEMYLANPPDYDNVKEEVKKLELQKTENQINHQEEEEKIEDDNISIFNERSEEEQRLEVSKYNVFRDFKELCCEKIFMLCTVSNAIFLFISTVIQFWTTDYLILVLKVDRGLANVLFVITCITSPTMGVIIGGIVVSKAGGYESKNCLIICTTLAFLACCLSFGISFSDTFKGFAGCLWVFLFFGGCVIPNLIGVILSSVRNDLRASGNSVVNFFTHLFGFIPAPFIYSEIYSAYPDSNVAYSVCVFYSWSSMVLLIIATVIRYRYFMGKVKEMQEMNQDNRKSIDIAGVVELQKPEDIKEPKARRVSNKNTYKLTEEECKDEFAKRNDFDDNLHKFQSAPGIKIPKNKFSKINDDNNANSNREVIVEEDIKLEEKHMKEEIEEKQNERFISTRNNGKKDKDFFA